VSFLEQIFITLRNAGLLAAKAGPGGGYKLRRRPSEISLIEIVRLIDGPIAPVRCVSHTAHEECPHEESCPLRPIMSDVRDAIAKILEPLTLEDACRRAGALRAER
jgi:Rrf2 family protein